MAGTISTRFEDESLSVLGQRVLEAMKGNCDLTFEAAVSGLMAGDFSRLAPLFVCPSDGSPATIIKWYDAGLFAKQATAVEEAFTCACFNGSTEVVDYLLTKGVSPSGGMNTGLNAFHWAANRGQLRTVEILLRHNSPLETLNAYGGTVLGCAVWSAVHERKPDHLRIIEALLQAGARIDAAEFPSGEERVDKILVRYGARI